MRVIVASIYLLLFSSCATIINEKSTEVQLYSNLDSVKVCVQDSQACYLTPATISLIRSKKDVELLVQKDTIVRSYILKSKLSMAFWIGNILNGTDVIGYAIDLTNPKRFTYPRTVYFDLNSPSNDYLTYIPLDSAYSRYTRVLKITPLNTVSMTNSGFEISCEKTTGNRFSTQLAAAYLFPMNVWDAGSDFKQDIKGFQLAAEEKYYLKRSAPLGPYVGFELQYLQNKYRDIGRFGVADIFSGTTNNDTNYTDTIGIRKKTYSINLKLGYQYIINRFSIDIYAGLGARYKDVVHSDRLVPADEMEIPRHPNVFYITNREGQYWTICIPLNVRIGWTF